MKQSAIAKLLAQTEAELGTAGEELGEFAKAEKSELSDDYDELDAATEASGDDADEDEEESDDDESDDDKPDDESDEDKPEMAKAGEGDEGYIDAGPILKELLGEIQGLRADVSAVKQGQTVMAKAVQAQMGAQGTFAKALGALSGQPMKPSRLQVPTRELTPAVVEADADTIMAKAQDAVASGGVSAAEISKFSLLEQHHGLQAALSVMPEFRKFIS